MGFHLIHEHTVSSSSSHHETGNHRPLYQSIIILLAFSLGIAASSAVAYKLWKKNKGTNDGAATTMTMTKYFDQLVLIMTGLDLAFGGIGITLYVLMWELDNLNKRSPLIGWVFSQICFVPQFWHTYMSYSVFSWVCLKRSVSNLQRSLWKSLGLVLVLAAVQCTISATLVATAKRKGLSEDLAYLEYSIAMSANFLAMAFFYFYTILSITRNLRQGKRLRRSYVQIVLRFLQICAVYVAVWGGWYCLTILWWLALNDHPSVRILRFFLFILVALYPLLDSLIMGRLIQLYRKDKKEVPDQLKTVASMSLKRLDSRHTEMGMLTNMNSKIFVTTLNCGGVKDLADLGDISQWIPEGYDVYCVGLQECLMLKEFRHALHMAVGGPGVYTVYHTEIGDATVLHGWIALTIMARTREVETGAFTILRAQTSQVKNGANLLVTKAPNKGMVGIGARYHDSTLAFITCHYAADCRGKTNLDQRNMDARRTLRDLCLVDCNHEFDAHLQHHHCFVLGDVNYRIRGLEPEEVLNRVVESATIEGRNKLFMVGRMPLAKQPSETEAEDDDDDAVGWLRQRYMQFFMIGEGAGGMSYLSPQKSTSVLTQHPLRLDEEDDEDDEDEKGGNDEKEGTDEMDEEEKFAHVSLELDSIKSSERGEEVDETASDQTPQHLSFQPRGWSARRLMSLLPQGLRGKTSTHGETSTVSSKGGVYCDSFVDSDANDDDQSSWRWVYRHDELIGEMKKGCVFGGFSEGPINFPPSFRWRPKAFAGDFDKLEVLQASYSTRKKGDGKRIPSYTDRILHHSLPDARSNLQLLHYGLCDSIIGSDHRPVSAAFGLHVNRHVTTTVVEPMNAPTSSSLPRPHGEHLSPTLPESESHVIAGNVLGVPRLVQDTSTSMYLERCKAAAVWSVKLSRFDYEYTGNGSFSEHNSRPAFITVHFPLLLEDPFCEERRSRMLEDSVGVIPSVYKAESGAPPTHDLTSNHTALNGAVPQIANLLSRAEPELLSTVFKKRFSSAEREGLMFKALVNPTVSRHALIKLTDSRGADLGQGVVCLRDALSETHVAERWMSRVRLGGQHGREAEKRGQKTPISVELSKGGRKSGTLRLSVRLSRREYSYQLTSGSSNNTTVTKSPSSFESQQVLH